MGTQSLQLAGYIDTAANATLKLRADQEELDNEKNEALKKLDLLRHEFTSLQSHMHVLSGEQKALDSELWHERQKRIGVQNECSTALKEVSELRCKVATAKQEEAKHAGDLV